MSDNKRLNLKGTALTMGAADAPVQIAACNRCSAKRGCNPCAAKKKNM